MIDGCRRGRQATGSCPWGTGRSGGRSGSGSVAWRVGPRSARPCAGHLGRDLAGRRRFAGCRCFAGGSCRFPRRCWRPCRCRMAAGRGGLAGGRCFACRCCLACRRRFACCGGLAGGRCFAGRRSFAGGCCRFACRCRLACLGGLVGFCRLVWRHCCRASGLAGGLHRRACCCRFARGGLWLAGRLDERLAWDRLGLRLSGRSCLAGNFRLARRREFAAHVEPSSRAGGPEALCRLDLCLTRADSSLPCHQSRPGWASWTSGPRMCPLWV